MEGKMILVGDSAGVFPRGTNTLSSLDEIQPWLRRGQMYQAVGFGVGHAPSSGSIVAVVIANRTAYT
jgi:hypothetical protein